MRMKKTSPVKSHGLPTKRRDMSKYHYDNRQMRRNNLVGVAGHGEVIQWDEARDVFWWGQYSEYRCMVKRTMPSMREAGEYRLETTWDDLFRYGTRVKMRSEAVLVLGECIKVLEDANE